MANGIWNKIFLDNTVRDWIITVAIILLALFFSRIISRLLANICVKIFTKFNHNSYSDIFKKNIVDPLSKYIFWAATVYALERLKYPDLFEGNFFKTHFSNVVDAVSTGWLVICFFNLIIGITIFITAILKTHASERSDRSALQMISLLSDLARAILIVLCILCILKFSFNYSLATFVTSLGLVTAALALAAKESVENVICSFVIFLDKPFFVGDSIKVNDITGTVEKIGLRSTLIRTDAKTLISMSNSSVISNALENTSNQTYRRQIQTLEVDLDTKPEDIKNICDKILELLNKKSSESITLPTVYFKETGVNSHKIYMEYYGLMNLTLKEFRDKVQQINLEIVALIQQTGIKIIRSNYR
ncbi:MAG: mechanosensitive ion channel [Arachidicoccus sp.]|nr:mechanosensitive ion channel [Arachidicoccus sp.]